MAPIESTFLWLAGKFGKEAVQAAATWSWDAARWKKAADDYAEKIERDYGRLPIFGKDTYVPITDIYTYVHLLEQRDALFDFDEGNLHRRFITRTLEYDPDKRQDGWRMVADGENLFILGDPGAGKTTFLKMAVIRAARGELRRQGDAPERLPIFVSLREHAISDRTLYESVKHELEVCGFPDADLILREMLKSGRVLLLWDGLDEVKTENDQRSILVAQMHEFMRQYWECRYVISCRIASADYTFGERRLRYVKMAPFSDEQIKRYLQKWFGTDQARAKQCYDELQSDAHRPLRELARTPILLTLLAIAYEETSKLPIRRWELYHQAIDALLRKWDADRGIHRGGEVYGGLELGYKWDLLTEVAAAAFYNGEFLLTRAEWGERIREFLETLPGVTPGVDGGLVVDSLAQRHGLFVRQTTQLYSLPHLSFQEYFTAKDIKESLQHDSLTQLLAHVEDDQWREVFLLTASALRHKDAAHFFDQFLQRIDQIALESPPLCQLLELADAATNRAPAAMQGAYKPPALRLWYLAFGRGRDRALHLDPALALHLDLDHGRVLDRARARALDFALAPDRSLNLDHARDRVLDRARDRALDFALALDLALALNLDLALALARVLVRALARVRVRARVRFRAPVRVLARDLDLYLARAIAKASALGLDEFADELGALEMPDATAEVKRWQAFAQELTTMIRQYRDLSGIDYLQENRLDAEQLEELVGQEGFINAYSRYLKATALFIDCLQLASLSDRAAVENRICLPPKSI